MPPRLLLRALRRHLVRPDPCIFCQSRQLLRPFQHARYSRATDINPKIAESKQRRLELDRQSRTQAYSSAKAQGHIRVSPGDAEALITQFMRGARVEDLAKTFKLKISEITELAIPILSASGPKNGQIRDIPRSYNIDLGVLLLGACSKAKDPLATLHILSSHYYALAHDQKSAISEILLPEEMNGARRHLEHLAHKENNPEALALLAQYVEREGNINEADSLYSKAISLWDPSVQSSMSKHMPPRIASPWAEYSNLLITRKDDRQKAKQVLEKGAFEADDSMSYYCLAQMEDPQSHKWLEHMTKVAASGHPDAMYRVGNFYLEYEAEGGDPEATKDSNLTKALSWLNLHPVKDSEDSNNLRYRPAALGWEWHDVAAKSGYKPSMLKLATWMAENELYGPATQWLLKILTPARVEDPLAVQEGRKLLAKLRDKSPVVQSILSERLQQQRSGQLPLAAVDTPMPHEIGDEIFVEKPEIIVRKRYKISFRKT